MLTQDPLGLAGGINLYEYAGSNPVSFDDPFGLDPCLTKGNCTQVQEGKVGAHNSAKIAQLRPDAHEKAKQAMVLAGQAGHTLYITQTYRTPDQQSALYRQGRTEPGRRVTACNGARCPHPERRAVDVYVYRDGQPRVNDATDSDMDVVGSVGEAAGFEWGGRWRKPDRPHWEVPRR